MSDSWDDEFNSGHQDDDCGYVGSVAESRDLEELAMARLVKWLDLGKSISRKELAEVLRITPLVDIPGIVRCAIINELDPKIKTGRARRHAFYRCPSSVFKRTLLRLEYREKRDKKKKEIEAMEEVATENNYCYDTVRSIVKSKD